MTPVDPPKILGLEMVRTGGWCYRLKFGCITVEILGGYGGGTVDDTLWCGLIEREYVKLRPGSIAECVAAIERDLLSIRAAIPERQTETPATKGGE